MTDSSSPRFETRVYADTAVMRLCERRYLSDTQSKFIDALRDAVTRASGRKVVIDLSGVELLTSGPIGGLVAVHRQLVREGGKIVTAGGGEFAVRVLSFAANVIEHYPDVQEALAAPEMSPDAALLYSQEAG